MKLLISISALASLSTAFGSSVVLTQSNYEDETNGKMVFIKFFAPWCGHCKSLAPKWTDMASELVGNPTVLVGEIDCDDENDLCEDHDIEGFPTIKWGSPDALSDYNLDMETEDMVKFVKNMKPQCSIANIDLCDDEKKALIESLSALSFEEINEKVMDVEKQVKAMEDDFETGLESIEGDYERLDKEHQYTLKKLKDTGNIALAKSVLDSKLSALKK